MARVTVEDCTDKITNRFELVVFAAQRTRQIAAGSPIGVERNNDKNPVVALREIADKYVHPGDLEEAVIAGFRSHVEVEPQEEEYADLFIQDTTYFIDQTKEMNGMVIQDSEVPLETFSDQEEDQDSEDSEDDFEDENDDLDDKDEN